MPFVVVVVLSTIRHYAVVLYNIHLEEIMFAIFAFHSTLQSVPLLAVINPPLPHNMSFRNFFSTSLLLMNPLHVVR